MRCCIQLRFIICNFVSQCNLLYAIWYQNAIYYMRLCVNICYTRSYIKIRFIICDVLSKCDLLYANLCQNAIHYMRLSIEMRFIFAILYQIAICYMRCLYQNVIYYMRLCATMRFIRCDFV